MLFKDLFEKMAKWLRKLNASPLRSACMVSNPVFVIFLIDFMEK